MLVKNNFQNVFIDILCHLIKFQNLEVQKSLIICFTEEYLIRRSLKSQSVQLTVKFHIDLKDLHILVLKLKSTEDVYFYSVL